MPSGMYGLARHHHLLAYADETPLDTLRRKDKGFISYWQGRYSK